MTRFRVILVAKRSTYDRFVDQDSDPRVRLLLRNNDESLAEWRRAHAEHQRTLEQVLRILDAEGAEVLRVRSVHAAFDASAATLVVAVGGDGTLLAASHSVGTVPVLGVNSAPRHSVGFFCAASRKNLWSLLPQALRGEASAQRLTRMTVRISGSVCSTRVLNEALFTHVSPAATSRYVLRHGRLRESQRSSGFWIGPAAGSTAAQRAAGGKVLPLGSKKLQLVVREPYEPAGQRYRLRRALLSPGEKLSVQSRMEDASLFLDGPHMAFKVRLSDLVEFYASDQPLTVLGLDPKRRRSWGGA